MAGPPVQDVDEFNQTMVEMNEVAALIRLKLLSMAQVAAQLGHKGLVEDLHTLQNYIISYLNGLAKLASIAGEQHLRKNR